MESKGPFWSNFCVSKKGNPFKQSPTTVIMRVSAVVDS